MTRSVIAMVDDEPWDMHRPLTRDCSLQLHHFKDEDPKSSNLAFWKSCSFILGRILETSFKEDLGPIYLCSFPPPNPDSGSFVYDVDLGNLGSWVPSSEELKCLSALAGRLHWDNLRFERLDVDASVALKIFQDNNFKMMQIPHIAEKTEKRQKTDGEMETPFQNSAPGTIPLYRLGDHVDISSGPMIPETRFIQPGRFTITSIHVIDSPSYGRLHRIQGVALPFGVSLHSHTYRILTKNATKPNRAPIPVIVSSQHDQQISDS